MENIINSNRLIDKKIEELVKKWNDKGMENYWGGFNKTELEIDLQDLTLVVIRELIKILKDSWWEEYYKEKG
jgi:hypothetical protein